MSEPENKKERQDMQHPPQWLEKLEFIH